jgi:hypothetical protein
VIIIFFNVPFCGCSIFFEFLTLKKEEKLKTAESEVKEVLYDGSQLGI